MDPIKDGKKIFTEITNSLSWDSTENIEAAKEFLDKLLYETKGLVIVDFLDSRNWDRIDGVEIMNEYLILKWHDYRGREESETEKELRSMAFSRDLYAALIHFNELRIVKTDFFPFIFIRGYAMKDKEIKNLLVRNPEEYKFVNFNDNFSKNILVKRNGYIEEYICLNTPIFSVIIFPKGVYLAPSKTQSLLYDINFSDSIERIIKIKDEIEKNEKTDNDFICEKANTARRIFEYVLKVECCYRYGQIKVEKNYSNLFLGDLVNLLKEFREDYIIQILNKCVIWSNELSHDSGKPIKKEKLLILVNFILLYTNILKLDVQINPHPHIEL